MLSKIWIVTEEGETVGIDGFSVMDCGSCVLLVGRIGDKPSAITISTHASKVAAIRQREKMLEWMQSGLVRIDNYEDDTTYYMPRVYDVRDHKVQG